MDKMMAMVESIGGMNDRSDNCSCLDDVEKETNTGQAMSDSDSGINYEDQRHDSTSKEDIMDAMMQIPVRGYLDVRDRKLREKIEFVRIVGKYRSILFGDCDGHEITPRSKEEAWKCVATEVEALALESYRGKPWARLRDHDWQYVRRHALARCDNSNKPTGKLGELDRLVLDIVNASSPGGGGDRMEKVLRQILSVENGRSERNQLDTTTPDLVKIEDYEENCDNVMNTEGAHIEESSFSLTRANRAHSNTPVSAEKNMSISRFDSTPPPNNQPQRCWQTEVVQKTLNISPSHRLSHSLGLPSCSSISTTPRKRHRVGDSDMDEVDCRKEELEIRRIELEIHRLELENQRVLKELERIASQERRAEEMHEIELAKAKLSLRRMENALTGMTDMIGLHLPHENNNYVEQSGRDTMNEHSVL